MSRMQAEAERAGATSVVETRLDVATNIWASHIMEFLSVGTAIRPTTGELTVLDPQVVLSLDG